MRLMADLYLLKYFVLIALFNDKTSQMQSMYSSHKCTVSPSSPFLTVSLNALYLAIWPITSAEERTSAREDWLGLSFSRDSQCLEERVVHEFQCICRKGVSEGPPACMVIALSQFFPSMTPYIEPVVISFASKTISLHPLPRQYILPASFKYAPHQWNVPFRMMMDLYFSGSLQVMG